jgi:hypothetical protein
MSNTIAPTIFYRTLNSEVELGGLNNSIFALQIFGAFNAPAA